MGVKQDVKVLAQKLKKAGRKNQGRGGYFSSRPRVPGQFPSKPFPDADTQHCRTRVKEPLSSLDASDVALRVTAPPPAISRPGETVTLAVAPEACVPLTEPETP
jgi:hypothetical protein